MARLLYAVPALALIALTMCHEAPTSARRSVATSFSRLDNGPSVQVFRVQFDPLNRSGVKAQATLQMTDDNLTVTLDAVGRVPEHIHPQHIHGFTSSTSTCPTASNDTNGDGIISFAEGLPSFGPVQVDLQPYPTPANTAGSTHYRVTFVAANVPFTAADLTNKTMVLHGDFVGSAYDASLPVACGRVEAIN